MYGAGYGYLPTVYHNLPVQKSLLHHIKQDPIFPPAVFPRLASETPRHAAGCGCSSDIYVTPAGGFCASRLFHVQNPVQEGSKRWAAAPYNDPDAESYRLEYEPPDADERRQAAINAA